MYWLGIDQTVPHSTENQGMSMSGKICGLSTEEILEGITAAEKRYDLLDSRREEFRKKYPDQFVAVTENDVVAVAKTMEKLLAELKKKGLESRDVSIEFMAAKDFDWVLFSWIAESRPPRRQVEIPTALLQGPNGQVWLPKYS